MLGLCKHVPTRTYSRPCKTKEESTWRYVHTEIPVEYESACRMCLDKSEVMTVIFSDFDSIVPITDKVKCIVGIEYCEEDRLPNLICDRCLCHLNDAYNFKKRTLASEAKLRQYLCTPFKPISSTSELMNKDIEKECDGSLPCEENQICLQHDKEDCTITWDDQVPLAAIISSAIPEISEKQLTDPPIVENNSIDNIEIGIDLSETVLDGDSNEVVLEIQKDAETKSLPEERRPTKVLPVTGSKNIIPPKKPVPPTPTSPPKTYKVIKTSRLISKISRDNCGAKQIDLDNCTLSERIRLDSLNAKIRRINSQKVASDSSPSQDEPGVKDCKEVEDSGEGKIMRVFGNAYVCQECSKAFHTPSLLARHIRIHTGEKPFACKECGKAFSQKEILQRHIAQKHTIEKPYKCKYCDRSFGTYSVLGIHINQAHLRRDMKHKCKLCPKVFKHASGLSRHMNIHNGTYFYCNVCGKHFTDGSSINRHTKIHVQMNDSVA